jgi:hypothetical protein
MWITSERQQYSGSGTLHGIYAWNLVHLRETAPVLGHVILRINFAICSKIGGWIGEQMFLFF